MKAALSVCFDYPRVYWRLFSQSDLVIWLTDLLEGTFSVYLSYWFYWRLLSQSALATRFYSAPGLINQREKTGLPLDDNKKWTEEGLCLLASWRISTATGVLRNNFIKMEPNLFTRGCIGNKTTGQSQVFKLSVSDSGYSEAEFRSGGCWGDN
jgi:hypothetical protein